MAIRFACPHCFRSYEVPDEDAGKKTRCPACREKLAIPGLRREEPAPGKPDARDPSPDVRADGAIPFACPTCGDRYELDPTLAGKQVFCRTCREPCRAPRIERAIRATPAALPPPPPSLPATRGLTDLFARQDTTRTAAGNAGGLPPGQGPAVVLWVIAGCLFLAALQVSRNLDEADARQGRIDDARYGFGVAVGELTGRYPEKYPTGKKSDRTLVYVLAVLGAVFVGLGFVCWAVGGQAAAAAWDRSRRSYPEAGERRGA